MNSWRDGMVKVFFDAGTTVLLKSSQLEAIQREWMNGNAFGEYEGIYNNRVFIKLGKVHGLMVVTPESVELEERDNLEDERRDKASRLLGDG